MGKTNNELNDFLKDTRIFADMVNLTVYNGEKIVRPNELEDNESVQYLPDHHGQLKERRNDVCKRCKSGTSYRIFCLENENKISYIMPVRGMEYEAGQYREQIRKTGSLHTKTDYKNWNELSSRFTKTDRLYPVITLVLYWCRESWDGPKTLVEMLDMTDKERTQLAPFLQDYKLNLVNMYELTGADTCESQLKYVLKILQSDKNKELLYQEVTENPEYQVLSPEAGKVIGILLGDDKLRELAEAQQKKGEVFNMCQALDDLRTEGRNEGIVIGRTEGIAIGKNEGIAIGKLEGQLQGKRTIILNMLRHQMSDADICVLTECTPELLEEIRREQKL